MEDNIIELKLTSIYFFTTLNSLSENKLEITNKTKRTLNCEFTIKPQNQHYKSFEDDAYMNFSIMEKKCHLLDSETKIIPLSFVSKKEGLYTATINIIVNKTSTYKVDLFAYVYVPDVNIKERRMIDKYLTDLSLENFFMEIIEDMIDDVKTSPPPLPDYSNDSRLREEHFNVINYSGGYVYNKTIYNELRNMRIEFMNGEKQYWDLNLQNLKDFIDKMLSNKNAVDLSWKITKFDCYLHYLRSYTDERNILNENVKVN